MARAANTTVRFTRVVERSGRPHVHTLWVPPEKDPEFKRARETHRVMTLEQAPGGGKADFGIVGFDAHHARGGQFLIFPKSLKRFEGARVVGVKFDLIEQPKLSEAKLETAQRAPSRAKSHHRPAKRAAPRVTRPPARRHEEAVSTRRHVVEFEAEHRKTLPEPLPEKSRAPEKRLAPSLSREHAALIREVRAAMKELERGKYVAAHQRLERALRET